MATNSATVVAASLDSSQLEASINSLVNMVSQKTKAMADNFTSEVARMEQAVKNLGNIKIDSGGTADGGSSRRTSKQKEEETQAKATTQAYKEQKSVVGELAMSFDNLNTAITKSNSKLAAKFDVTEQQKVQQLEAQRTAIDDKIVARQIEIDESYRSQLATLAKTRSELESKANLTSKEQADLKHVTTEWERINKIVRDISSRPIVAADDPTGSIGRLQQQLVETNKQLDESRKRIQEMNFERAKMYDGSLSSLVQNAQATMKYQNDTLKKSFEDLLKKPTHDVDEMRAKMERLQTFLNNIKPLNIFSPELIANGERAINKLKNEIQKFNDNPTKQAFADALKLPDRKQGEILTKIRNIRDAIKSVEGTKIVSETEIARAKSLLDSLHQKLVKLYNAPKDRQLRIDFADALKMPTNNIDEIAAKLMRLQYILQEMRGMEVLSPQQIANGNQQISALLSKLEAEMSLRQQINAVQQADMQNAQKRIELEAKYGEEVAKAAAIANDWLQKNKETAILNKEGTFAIYDPKSGQVVGQSIEAQLLTYKAINGELNLELEVQKAIQNTVESIERAEQRRIALAQGKNATSNKSFADYEDLRTAIASVLRIRESEVSLANSEDASYKALSLTLKQLKQAYESLSASQRKSENAVALIASIHETQRAMQEIQKQMSRPVNLANALALPEKTIDDISYKIQMLKLYAQGVNAEVGGGRFELTKVNNEVERLNEKTKDWSKSSKQVKTEINSIKFDSIAKMPTENLKQVGAKIKEVKQYINELKNQPIVDEKNIKRAEALYDRLIKQSQKLNDAKGTHSNVNNALNVRVKTLDEIAKKMQRLQAIRQNLDINKQKADIDRINAALGELKKQQDGVLQRNANMIKSNNALGRSWNYMKNRLAFYFTVGASTQFIKNLIEVRSQYEMNERALGILIGSAERGTQIFNELSQMALVSPYTLIELSAAAKQLTAYDIAARDVVDTTRRLADMASAVGVPIERLTYALGQIKAYGYLNSRDARMFANAGIPLVKQLSEYYTELEGKMVSTADVYDRMKKKAIDYNSVMAVVTKMTDEGGKFFDFQAKMADTLKVRLANLTLAWNNMLNDMGKETQGVLTWSIGALRDLFLQWKNLYGALNEVAFVLGVAKALQFLGVCAHAAGIGFGSLNKYMTLNALLGTKLATTVRTLGSSFVALVHSPLVWFTMAALLVTEIGDAIINADRATKEFNKSLRDGAKTTYEDLKKFAEQYKNIRDSLYKTETTRDVGGKETTTITPQNIEEGEAKKVWEAMREQIELSSHASDEYISKLLSIENVSERLRQGFQILDDIQTVSAALKDIGDDGIKVTQGWAAWWNAWQGADGLIQNLKDLQEELQRLKDAGSDPDDKFVKVIDKDYHTALERFRKDLKVTTDSVINFINLNGWSGDTGKIDEVFKQVTDRLATQSNLDPQTAFTLQKDVEIARAKAAKEALEIRIDDEKKALATASNEISKQQIQKNLETLEQQKRDFDKFNGENRAYWNDFTKYIKERHISELTAAYNSMTDHGKKAMDFQSEEWQKHVHDWANRYEKSHNLATDSVFNRLRNWINDANTWSVFIKMTISTEDGKSVYKQLEEYDKAADDAWKTMQRLDKRISQLRKKGAKEVEGAEAGVIDLSRVSQDDKELTEAIKERTQAQKDYNEAIEKGGESKKENSAASKAQKQAESELAKALKDELKLIETVRSSYKDLTKEGASHADAIEKSVSGYEKSIANINAVLNKYGISLDLSKFAGISNPHELQKMLQNQLNALLGKAKPAEIQALEVELKKVDLDVEKYDLTKITKGLNNELDRLKEEYELAVSLDADPELGGIFADMFDLHTDQLPHTISEYAQRVTTELNKAIKDRGDSIQLPTIYLTKDDIDAFRKMSEDGKLNTKSFEDIQKAYQDFVSLRKKAATDVSKIASDYIREYGDLSAQIQQIEIDKNDALMKLNEIYNTDALRQTQRYLDAKFAIEDGAKRKQAKATFDALKKESDYERFFTAIDTLTEKDALSIKNKIKKGIIDSFKNGGLTASQFRKEIKALEEQFDKLSQPTSNWISYLSGGFDKLIQRAKETGQEIETIGEKISITGKVDENDKNYLQSLGSIFNNGKGGNTDFSSLMSLFGKDMKGLGSNISEAGQGMQAGASGFAGAVTIVDAIIKNVHQTVQAIGSVIDELDSVRNEENKISNAYWEGFKKFDNYATSGWENLKSGNVAGAIADTANSIISIFNTFSNAKNEKINKEIKESERAIKRLELAYIDLEQAVEKAYGMATIGANMAAKANKELQLEELKRQLTLERSRDSKRRDEDKIVELKKQIKELEYDIADTVDSIVNDLLGISSVGDALENVMGNIIEAFRSGSYKLKDIMKDVKISFNDMIANMVMKMYTTKVLQPWFEEQWNTVQNQINERAGEIPNKLAEVQSKVSEAKIADLNDNDSIFEALRTLGMDNEQMLRLHFDTLFNKGGNAILRDAYEKALKEAEQKEAEIQKELTTATMPTTDDFMLYAELLRNGQPIVTDRLKEIESFLRELGLLNDKKETTLSALQAGISGITEDTAGALEAYMNGVSQQVYLQSDLLTQIRDAVFAFDVDVQVATMSQILLQLQSSYTVQMSIQGILEGVLNPSGRAFTVELVS